MHLIICVHWIKVGGTCKHNLCEWNCLFLQWLFVFFRDIGLHLKQMIPVTTKPRWLSKYNYLSLLNIPILVKLFGPMINLWEGSNQGEGCLLFAKPKLSMLNEILLIKLLMLMLTKIICQTNAVHFSIMKTAEWIEKNVRDV